MTDATRYLQEWITYQALGGSRVVGLEGEYEVSDTLRIPPSVGFHLSGESMHGTVIRWTGPADRPVILRRDVRDSWIGNFKVLCQTPLLGVFETGTQDATTPGRIVTTNNQTHRVFVDEAGHSVGTYHQYGGTGYDGHVYPDSNNEGNIDADIHANGVAIGIHYNGHQCKANVIRQSRFQGHLTLGLHGVMAHGGSFKSDVVGGSGFADAFYRIYNQTDALLIDWPDIERSARLIHTTGPTGGRTGSTQPIEIRGGRFMCDGLAPDRVAVWTQDGGICHLRSIIMGGGEQPIPIVRADGFRSHVSAHGVDFGAYGSTPNGSFSWAGDVYFDVGLNTYHKPATDPQPGNGYTVRGIPGVTDSPTLDYAHGGGVLGSPNVPPPPASPGRPSITVTGPRVALDVPNA